MSPEALLRRVAAASDRDLAGLGSGLPFVTTIDAGSPRELAQVHAIRVRAPVAHIVERIRRDHLLLDEAGPATRGTFGDPPATSDLAELTLSRSEVRDLQRCRPSACGLKLPVGTAERLGDEVDWAGRNGQEDANRLYRQVLLETLAAYASSGDRAGLTYEDKEEPLEVGEGFRLLLDRVRYIDDLDPTFRRYLGEYPQERSPLIEDLFTWTVEDLGVKPLVSLKHIAFKRGEGTSDGALIGIKRIYANHYFQADLRIICIWPAGGDAAAPDAYVMVFSRQRFDGDLGGIRRVATERRLERVAEGGLSALKTGIEASYRAARE